MRRTGPVKPLYKMTIGPAVLRDGLPKPVDKEALPKVEVAKDHGLWDFFNSKKELLTLPVDEFKFGTAVVYRVRSCVID